MKKILYNKTLFIIATVIVLASLILGTLEYIDLGFLIVPMVLPYLIWLFMLMRLGKKQNKWNASGSNQPSLMWLQNNYTVSLCGFIGVCIGYFTGHQEICIIIGVGIGILIRFAQRKSKWNALANIKDINNEKYTCTRWDWVFSSITRNY